MKTIKGAYTLLKYDESAGFFMEERPLFRPTLKIFLSNMFTKAKMALRKVCFTVSICFDKIKLHCGGLVF